ncbi:MAG TPA: glycerol kinase [Lutibacter sp.]|nr:glycerol kinase [Lutibacter sp.]
MSNIRIAAVDQGTTSTKIMSLENNGESKITFQRTHAQIVKNSGWVEHNPDEIYENICYSLQSVENIDAIGLSHQGETIVAWDAHTKEALYNMIVWQDQRTEKEVQRLKDDGLEPIIQEKTGLLLDSYFPASKISWLLKNVPAVKLALKKKRLRIGTSESFFIDRLTGVYCTDYNSASRTSLFNAKTLEWDDELCKIFDVPIDILPPIRSNIGEFGFHKLNGKYIPLTSVMVDQFAAVYGHGCSKIGDSKATFGTGAFMQVITGNELVVDKKTGLSSALFWKFGDEKPVFGLDAGVYNVGSAVDWLEKLGLFDTYKEINNFEKKSAIERDVIFVPALSGLACPYWDRTASGTWTGLSLETQRADLLQSVLEGIAFRAVSNFKIMDNFTKLSEKISIDGGLVKNPYFAQFFTDVVGKKVTIPQNNELTSLGVGLLAYKGLGLGDLKIKETKNKEYMPNNVDRELWLEKFERVVQKSRGTRVI